MKNLLRILTLALTLFLTLNCNAQHPTYRKRNYHGYGNNVFHYKAILSLAVGPETAIAFPPKISFHAYLPKQEVVYGGADFAFGTFGFSSTLGATVGVRYKFLILENSFSRTSIYQAHAPNKIWLSNNPKIGIEIEKFTLKVGPSFIIKEYNGHHELQDLLLFGGQHFNIEIGYIFESN